MREHQASLPRARFNMVSALADYQPVHAMWLKALGRMRDAAWVGRFTPRPAGGEAGPMPPYKDLPEAELQAIGACLDSLR